MKTRNEKNQMSKTYEEAKKNYQEKSDELLKILLTEYPGTIDLQYDNQVAVWFDGFSICYQSSDMNGNNKGKAHWDNDGADSVMYELRDILSKDERFQPLIASEEYYKYEYLTEFINLFCCEYARLHNITNYFYEDADEDEYEDEESDCMIKNCENCKHYCNATAECAIALRAIENENEMPETVEAALELDSNTENKCEYFAN